MQSEKKFWLPILGAGILTTVLTMVTLHFLNGASADLNIMGWYGWGIIPIGALLVGATSGSGFGLAAWLAGVRMKKDLLLIVLCIQVAAYIGMEYISYTRVLHLLQQSFQGAEVPNLSFLEYLDMSAKSMSMKLGHSSSEIQLGAWGYAFRLLEAGGFSLGGLIIPTAVSGMAYCERCQRYWRQKSLVKILVSATQPLVQKKDEQAQATYVTEASQSVEKLQELAKKGDAFAFQALVDTLKASQGSTRKREHYAVTMSYCPNCHDALLRVTHMQKVGRELNPVPLETTAVSDYFAKTITTK